MPRNIIIAMQGRLTYIGKHLISGDTRLTASLGLITRFIQTECNRSRLASVKFPLAIILDGTIVALWRQLRNSESEVLVRTHSLLCKVRHRAMITPVIPLRTSLIRITQRYWTIYRSFEIIFEWELSIELVFKSDVLCKPISSQNIQADMKYIFKNTYGL